MRKVSGQKPQGDESKKIGQTLRECRIARGLTLEEAAKQIGCSFPHLSTIERDATHGSARMVAKINAFYGLGEKAGKDAAPPHVDQNGFAFETEKFCDWVKRRRKSLHLSQRALSRKAGMKDMTISYIERGEKLFTKADTVKKLENVLGPFLGEWPPLSSPTPQVETLEEPKEVRETFNQWVKRRRLEMNLSQDALAKKSGLKDATISRVERGASLNVQASTISRLENVLGKFSGSLDPTFNLGKPSGNSGHHAADEHVTTRDLELLARVAKRSGGKLSWRVCHELLFGK